MKTLMIACMVMAAGLAEAAKDKADIKIGYVNVQRAIEMTKDGKKAKAKLEKEFKRRKKSLEKREKDIKAMQEDLSKKASVMSDDARLKKQQGLQQEMMRFGELYRKNQMEMEKERLELTRPILKKIQKVIRKIAEKENYTVILNSEQGVIWAKKDIDLTDQVVKQFNK